MKTKNSKLASQKKIVVAPLPSHSLIIPSIYSITINEDQEVEWQWLKLPDGNRVVTNYKIVDQKSVD